jgi:glutaminase
MTSRATATDAATTPAAPGTGSTPATSEHAASTARAPSSASSSCAPSSASSGASSGAFSGASSGAASTIAARADQTSAHARGAVDRGPSGPVAEFLADLHDRVRALVGGEVASYIPELAKQAPDLCAIAIATVDGAIYQVGDSDHAFTIQSVSKPFVYGYALQEYGRETVLAHVGVEPTGDAFNSIVLDQVRNRPFNPMVNAGAIAMSELIRGATPAARVETLLDLFSSFAGRRLTVDEAVFVSEKTTGHRNRAIAYMMLNSGMIAREPEDILDIYFRQCAIEVTTRDLALMSAALANDGVHPLTGARALASEYVHDVLTVMNTCGMYNYAGHWSYDVGVPAKSGVSGSIIAVIPGQAGIAVFSPPIDANGNSVRGLEACRAIAEEFGLHAFKTHPDAHAVIRREMRGDVVRSKRARAGLEARILDEQGGAIRVIEAQDALFFASAERLLRRATLLAREARYLIIDVRRVYRADAAACALMARFAEGISAEGCVLAFAHMSEDGPLGPLRRRLARSGSRARAPLIFADRDDALEWCENQILGAASAPPEPTRYAVGALDIFRGLDDEQLRLVEALAQPLVFEAGETIMREGDPARLFFVITRGAASVRIAVSGDSGGRKARIASIGPGVSFGEMALLDGGRRSADVVADEKVVCYGFSVEALRDLGASHPSILVTLFANLTRDLSERLRRANGEIRALET